MKKIILVAFITLFLISCSTSPKRVEQAGGLEDFEAAKVALNQGNNDEAIRLFTNAIASGELVREQLKTAYKFLGNAWFDKGDYDRAIAEYTKAIEIDPRFAVAYYNRGLAWGKKGDYDRAIAEYTKAIELDPEHADAYNNRGIAWVKKGEYDKAITDWTKAIELDPTDAVPYYNRGLA
jgi:tetratricopeptide (TPR) repeat protein